MLINMKTMYSVRAVGTMTVEGGLVVCNTYRGNLLQKPKLREHLKF